VSALAALEAGSIQEALNDLDAAAATFQAAADSLERDDAIRALLLSRVASAMEAKGSWLEAGQAFELASEIVSYPLRYNALADAARCYAEAGQVERALEAFARVESEAPDLAIPEHIESQLRELRAGQQPG
jgi:tetratricopeptide (TPR) repeat protein